MPRQSRYDANNDRAREQGHYGSGQRRYPDEPKTAGADEDYGDFSRRNSDNRDMRFEDDDTGYYDRSGRDYPRQFRENGRNRDRADRAQVSYDDNYQGRSPRSDWEQRGSDGVVLPAGPSAYRNERGRGDHAHYGKGPKDYQRSDDRIREDVCDRLSKDGSLDASDISVRVEKGEVTLDGHVDSRRAKRAAEDCVDTVSGVNHCQNNLRIAREQSGSQADGRMAGNAEGRRETSSRKAKQN